MVILFDTNIVIDYFAKREPFVQVAKEVFHCCTDDRKLADGYVAAHSIMDICYILRKQQTQQDRVDMIRKMCNIVSVVETTSESILAAAEKMDFKDFEDSVVNQAAVTCDADYIITRNLYDFKTSDVPAVSPNNFLAMFASIKDN